jgi:hypothetical protein
MAGRTLNCRTSARMRARMLDRVVGSNDKGTVCAVYASTRMRTITHVVGTPGAAATDTTHSVRTAAAPTSPSFLRMGVKKGWARASWAVIRSSGKKASICRRRSRQSAEAAGYLVESEATQ